MNREVVPPSSLHNKDCQNFPFRILIGSHPFLPLATWNMEKLHFHWQWNWSCHIWNHPYNPKFQRHKDPWMHILVCSFSLLSILSVTHCYCKHNSKHMEVWMTCSLFWLHITCILCYHLIDNYYHIIWTFLTN